LKINDYFIAEFLSATTAMCAWTIARFSWPMSCARMPSTSARHNPRGHRLQVNRFIIDFFVGFQSDMLDLEKQFCIMYTGTRSNITCSDLFYLLAEPV